MAHTVALRCSIRVVRECQVFEVAQIDRDLGTVVRVGQVKIAGSLKRVDVACSRLLIVIRRQLRVLLYLRLVQPHASAADPLRLHVAVGHEVRELGL